MWQRLYTRARELDPLRADALLAALFATAGVVESFLVKSGGHSRPLTAVFAVAISIPLAWRRRNTMAAVIGLVAAVAVDAPLDTFLFSNLTTPFIVVLLMAYSVGRHQVGWRVWLELALLVMIVVITGGIRTASDVLFTVVFLGLPALAGRALRSRALFQNEMREKASQLQQDRLVRAQRAVEEERARIASELQAVVANGVSAMVVQAEAVPRLFGAGDRGAATQAFVVIEETGRDALAEMRRLLGVLRREDEDPALAPQPTLARADALVARMQAEGLEAAITVEGEPVPLAPGIDLAGYRVLQEALASATRAGGVSHADVSIVYGDDSVLVKVRDDRQSSDGQDPEVLRALRERVNLYGGALRAVPGPDSQGFEVEARLPIGGPR
ncbi:MAG TPA: histidine kinase [Solirubrobacteraceae bacterium]|nr:histidine kinase [Solirubrobacteraceae bacterium]